MILASTVSWVLSEDMRLLDQKQRTWLFIVQQVARASYLCLLMSLESYLVSTEGPLDSAGWTISLYHSWGSLSLGNPFFYSNPALCPGRRHYLIPQYCSLPTQLWEMSRDGTNLCIVSLPARKCRDSQGPWWIACLNSVFIPLHVQLNWMQFNTCQGDKYGGNHTNRNETWSLSSGHSQTVNDHSVLGSPRRHTHCSGSTDRYTVTFGHHRNTWEKK